MYLKSLFLSLLICASLEAFSQADFRPGYIIRNNGDSLTGEIDYLNENKINTLCRFKDSAGNVTEYLPGQIATFRFTGSRYFVSRNIDNQEVFLEFLVQGKLNVYALYAPVRIRYFIEKEGEELSELVYRQQRVNVDNREKLHKTKLHIGMLTYLTQDAPQLKSQINRISVPEHRNMIQLAEDYHNAICEEGQECMVYERRFPKIKVTLELLGGLMSPWKKEQLGITARFWLPYSSEKFFVRMGYIYMGEALETSLIEVGEPFSHRFIPFHFGYIAPRNYLVRPMASIGIVSTDYSLGLTFRADERVNIGIQSYLQFYPIRSRWIPEKFKAVSVLAGMYIDLN